MTNVRNDLKNRFTESVEPSLFLLFVGYVSLLGPPLSIIAAVAMAAWFFFARKVDQLSLHIVPLLLLPTALAISFVFSGAGHSGQLSPNVQRWIFTGLVFGVFTFILVSAAKHLGYRSQFSIRSCLIASLVIAVILATCRQFSLTWAAIGLPIDFFCPRLISESSSNQTGVLNLGFGKNFDLTVLSFWLWADTGGPFWTSLLFATGLALWILFDGDLQPKQGPIATTTAWIVLLCTSLWFHSQPVDFVESRPRERWIEDYLYSPNYYAPIEEHLTTEPDG